MSLATIAKKRATYQLIVENPELKELKDQQQEAATIVINPGTWLRIAP